jgi:hypothetical protein
MVRGFGNWEVWMLPVMYTVFRDLRFLAIQVGPIIDLADSRRIKTHDEEGRRNSISRKRPD